MGLPQNNDEALIREVKKIIKDGIVKLTAVQMNLVVRFCIHPLQRKIRDPEKVAAKQHISVLADMMRRDEWLPRRQIDFASLNGDLWVVNGTHRACAQVESGKTIEWTVAIHPVQDDTELRRLFYKFDTNLRPRSERQILGAVGFSEKGELPHEVRKGLYQAALTISHDFDLQMRKQDVIHSRNVDRRLQLASAWIKEAALYAECIDGAEGSLKKKLRLSGVMAVALVTLRYQKIVATEFWTTVALNDGLRKNDPRHALVTDLLTRNYRGGVAKQTVVVPALAWSAFFAGETRTQLRVTDTSRVLISGTPWEGGGRK